MVANMARRHVAAVRYTYAQVEAALRASFNVPSRAEGGFRGRVRHLQRIGLFDIAPGKGQRILYTFVQCSEWMLALLLAQVGVDPIVIVRSFTRQRKKLDTWILEAVDDDALAGNEVFLDCRPQLMSGTWSSKRTAGILSFEKIRIPRPLHSTTAQSSNSPPAPGSNALPLAPPPRPTHHLSAEDLTVASPDIGGPEFAEIRRPDPLVLLINLTIPVRTVGEALRGGLVMTEQTLTGPSMGLSFATKY
jgi:hypothetical protein